jgi:hypothetical protein
MKYLILLLLLNCSTLSYNEYLAKCFCESQYEQLVSYKNFEEGQLFITCSFNDQETDWVGYYEELEIFSSFCNAKWDK